MHSRSASRTQIYSFRFARSRFAPWSSKLVQTHDEDRTTLPIWTASADDHQSLLLAHALNSCRTCDGSIGFQGLSIKLLAFAPFLALPVIPELHFLSLLTLVSPHRLRLPPLRPTGRSPLSIGGLGHSPGKNPGIILSLLAGIRQYTSTSSSVKTPHIEAADYRGVCLLWYRQSSCSSSSASTRTRVFLYA
ncbi:hypothetical protein DENSPDRAFT_707241 [Dentipellis sp. KUC8613]|nr:hypothetical protein DENSPDRAFT_707241 [Dentipellis sp. KUC8613]